METDNREPLVRALAHIDAAARDIRQHLAGRTERTGVDAWLTMKQAAQRAGMSTATLKRSIRNGTLKAYQIDGGRVWRMRASAVDAWLAGE